MKNIIEVEYIKDEDQLSRLYVDMVNGKVNPKKGFIVKPN